jgi:hypothetical protein
MSTRPVGREMRWPRCLQGKVRRWRADWVVEFVIRHTLTKNGAHGTSPTHDADLLANINSVVWT